MKPAEAGDRIEPAEAGSRSRFSGAFRARLDEAWAEIRDNPGRSILQALGVMLGVASVLGGFSISDSQRKQSERIFATASDRVPVPVNLAGWEPAAPDSPAIVVHAAALRTALLGGAPSEASRPMIVLLLSAAALVFLVRGLGIALAAALLAAIVAFAASLLALRGGLVLPVASIFFTLALAWGARAAGALRPSRRR